MLDQAGPSGDQPSVLLLLLGQLLAHPLRLPGEVPAVALVLLSQRVSLPTQLWSSHFSPTISSIVSRPAHLYLCSKARIFRFLLNNSCLLMVSWIFSILLEIMDNC